MYPTRPARTVSKSQITFATKKPADSVWVDVREIERKLRGEPTPEYYK